MWSYRPPGYAPPKPQAQPPVQTRAPAPVPVNTPAQPRAPVKAATTNVSQKTIFWIAIATGLTLIVIAAVLGGLGHAGILNTSSSNDGLGVGSPSSTGGVGVGNPSVSSSSSSSSSHPSSSSSSSVVPVFPTYRLTNAVTSGTFIDSRGLSWLADPSPYTRIDYTSDPGLAERRDPMLYRVQRYTSSWSYSVPVWANNYYDIVFLWEDPALTATGQRVFSVTANAATCFTNFDLYASSNSTAKAGWFKCRSVYVSTAYTTLTITLTASIGSYAFINSFAVSPTPTAWTFPIRMTASIPTDTIADSSGNVWIPDDYYTAPYGGLGEDLNTIAGATDQFLYKFERTGPSLNYSLPNIPAGSYNLQFLWSELYFTAAGLRVFSVAVNGQQCLTGVDIYSLAGAAHSAIQRTCGPFASSSGWLNITLVASVNQAKINAFVVSQA